MIKLSPSLPRRLAVVLGLAAMLAGCGNTPDTGFGGKETLALAKALVPAGKKPAAGGIAIIDIPAQTLAEWPEPLIVVAVENTRSSAALGRIARNGPYETYSAAEPNHITLREGVVVATRGLGVDLMSSAPPARATIATGRGSYSRNWQMLDGLDQIRTVTMSCTLAQTGAETIVMSGRSYKTRIVSESCTGDGGKVDNLYWVDPQGVLRRSRQWLGQDAGYMLLFDPNSRKFAR